MDASPTDFLGAFAGARRQHKPRHCFAGGPPLAFQDVRYLMTALAAALLALAFPGRIGPRTKTAIVGIDAAAIGFFAVAASTRALDGGLTVLPALIPGVLTAVGGGALRDVIGGWTPKIFESGQLYAVAALLGWASFLAGNSAGLPQRHRRRLG